MALSAQNYLKQIRDNLDAVLNLRYQPSQLVERQVHPEVEFQDNARLLLSPILIAKGENETVLIEASINSVRVSVQIKKGLEVEILLTKMLERFMSLRADKFEILRKKPAHDNYDFSFVITDDHLQRYRKEELINFILEFIQGIDKEIAEMKLSVVNQCRQAACFFTYGLCNNKLD